MVFVSDKADTINAFFNKNAFRANAAGQFGNAGRRIITAPGVVNLDVSVMKSVRFTETHRVQLRFDSFNLPNHANLSAPNAVLTSPALGRISAAGAGRIQQVSAKYVF